MAATLTNTQKNAIFARARRAVKNAGQEAGVDLKMVQVRYMSRKNEPGSIRIKEFEGVVGYVLTPYGKEEFSFELPCGLFRIPNILHWEEGEGVLHSEF